MKTCTKCNSSYEDDKKFCKKCGIPLTIEYNINPKEIAKKQVYEDRLKADPLNEEILQEYSQFLFNNLLLKESISVLLKILAINESNYFAKELLLKSYNKLKMAKEAVEIGELLLKEKPEDIALLEELAKTSNEIGDINKAIDYYNKIIKIQPANTNVLNEIALIFLEKNDIEKAIEVFTNLYEKGKDDRIVKIYTGIGKALKADYATAINLLSDDYSVKADSLYDLDNIRSFLHLAFSLCQTNANINEVNKWFNLINIELLKENYHILDENALAKTVSYILTKNIDTISKTSNVSSASYLIENLIKDYLISTEFYFTQNTNPIIANLWYILACKQEDLKLYSIALNTCKKAVYLIPEENKYKGKITELNKIITTQSQKSKRKTIIAIVSIIAIIVIIIISFFLYLNYKEKSTWEKAKETNTFASYQSYINEYPDGKFITDSKPLLEEALWKETFAGNTKQQYDNYLSLYPNGKYSNVAVKIQDSIFWFNVNKINKPYIYKEYLNKFSINGKHYSEASVIYDNLYWDSILPLNSENALRTYLDLFSKGIQKDKVSYIIENINKTKTYNTGSYKFHLKKGEFLDHWIVFPQGFTYNYTLDSPQKKYIIIFGDGEVYNAWETDNIPGKNNPMIKLESLEDQTITFKVQVY